MGNQNEHSLFKTVSGKTACTRRTPADLHSWACYQGRLAITECTNILRKPIHKSSIQREERQKRWTCCTLHTAKPLHWEIPGPPTKRPSPASACTRIPEQPQHASRNSFASVYHCQELFSRGSACTPRRWGAIASRQQLHEEEVSQRSQGKT